MVISNYGNCLQLINYKKSISILIIMSLVDRQCTQEKHVYYNSNLSYCSYFSKSLLSTY
nr:MAG TPA: hypothetical protein [Caudoviricetes sp.]